MRMIGLGGLLALVGCVESPRTAPTPSTDGVFRRASTVGVSATAVANPGRKAYTGRDTVISAVASAGFNERSWPQRVRVSRPSLDAGDGATIEIDMTRVYLAGDTRQNYLLNEGDIIYVPYSP